MGTNKPRAYCSIVIVYNFTYLQNKDEENTKLDFTSGVDFIIHRKLIEIDGEKGYMTFVYLL